MRELNDSIGPAANQSVIESRMAGCSDNEQLNFEFFSKVNDVSHRVPGNDVRIKLDMMLFGHRACALQNLVKTPRCRPRLLANLLDEFRHVVDLFNRNHMKIRVVLLCHRKRHRECMKGVFRPVIGVQNLAEHLTTPGSFGFSGNRSKLRHFAEAVGRLLRIGLGQEVARKIERIGDHRWDHGAGDYRRDKRRILALVDYAM